MPRCYKRITEKTRRSFAAIPYFLRSFACLVALELVSRAMVVRSGDFSPGFTVLENFESYPSSAFPTTWRRAKDDARLIYRVETENDNHFLRAVAKPGDVIARINEDEVRTESDFSALLGEAGSGALVNFTIFSRNHPTPESVEVKLGGSFQPVFEKRFFMNFQMTLPGPLAALGILRLVERADPSPLAVHAVTVALPVASLAAVIVVGLLEGALVGGALARVRRLLRGPTAASK